MLLPAKDISIHWNAQVQHTVPLLLNIRFVLAYLLCSAYVIQLFQRFMNALKNHNSNWLHPRCVRRASNMKRLLKKSEGRKKREMVAWMMTTSRKKNLIIFIHIYRVSIIFRCCCILCSLILHLSNEREKHNDNISSIAIIEHIV